MIIELIGYFHYMLIKRLYPKKNKHINKAVDSLSTFCLVILILSIPVFIDNDFYCDLKRLRDSKTILFAVLIFFLILFVIFKTSILNNQAAKTVLLRRSMITFTNNNFKYAYSLFYILFYLILFISMMIISINSWYPR